MHSIGLLCCRSVCLSICAYFDRNFSWLLWLLWNLYINAYFVLLSDDLHINDTIHSISLSVINSDNCSAALKLNRPPSSYQHPPTYTLHPICYWLRLEGELLLYYILYISIYTRTYQSQSQKQSDRLIYYIHTNTFAADDSHYLFPLSNQHNHHFTTSTDLITSIAPVMKYRKQLARLLLFVCVYVCSDRSSPNVDTNQFPVLISSLISTTIASQQRTDDNHQSVAALPSGSSSSAPADEGHWMNQSKHTQEEDEESIRYEEDDKYQYNDNMWQWDPRKD